MLFIQLISPKDEKHSSHSSTANVIPENDESVHPSSLWTVPKGVVEVLGPQLIPERKQVYDSYPFWKAVPCYDFIDAFEDAYDGAL